MRHVYECPMRWADLDLLGHVNNVVYVDYLQEARIDMLVTHAPDRRADELAEGVVVVRHEVGYRSPLTFDRPRVSIECWVTEIRAASFTMAYEIFTETPETADAPGGRTVFVRALTVLTPYVFETERPRRLTPQEKEALGRFLEPAEPVRPSRSALPEPADDLGHYPLQVRFSDVDVYGHVNNVKYFEYFQEARIAMLQRLFPGRVTGRDIPLVVAQIDVDYRVPILFRPQPYDVITEVTHVGRSSFVLEATIRDRAEGDVELSRARVVMVTFDPATQAASAMSDDYRAVLTRRCSP